MSRVKPGRAGVQCNANVELRGLEMVTPTSLPCMSAKMEACDTTLMTKCIHLGLKFLN